MKFRSKSQKLTFSVLAVLIALSASSAGAQAPATKTLWVAHYRVDCVGVGPQKCMLVKEEQYSPWQTFYGQIEGFDYVEGYAYELRVVEEKIDNPPADGSSIRVKVVEVISRYESFEPPAEPAPMPSPPEEAKPAAPVVETAPVAVAKTSEPAKSTIRGIVRSGLGPETRSFQPCGAREETWVVDRTDGELSRLYRKLTGGATRPMYVEVQGSLEPAPKEGFAANYSRQLVVEKIEQAVSGSKGCDED
jgi:hypothetical protein